MTFPPLSAERQVSNFPLAEGISWFDSDTSCTIVVSTPSADPALWADFVDGAVRSYHRNRVERALDIDSLLDEANTQLFHAAVDDSGKVVGGIRAKGPLESADESHAIVEWDDRPGLRTVRKMLTDRLPFGVVEMKTAWVSDDPNRRTKAGKSTRAHSVSHDGAARCTVRRGDGRITRTHALAHLGWRRRLEDSGHAVSRRPIPYEDDVVGSQHLRQPC